jgi:hypothetical protein
MCTLQIADPFPHLFGGPVTVNLGMQGQLRAMDQDQQQEDERRVFNSLY